MKKLICITLLSSLSAISYAEDAKQAHEQTKASGVEALSPELRNLLTQEMKALQDGMMSIIPAYVSGNWHEIEATAGKIKNSYLLKQNLTENQIKELHSSLPPEFIEKDKKFHYLAGMLEHVAHNKKPELINFYFSEMTEACAGCHVKFAIHKFPGLKPVTKDKHIH
ncbi:hypothetical protein [methane-oxidizing endosymbiont of Gigantopelta aegis]|uniref:hypothetical protein n=1 Tax=methane-oxidizing endosymbiont of Gigantopelta aegis TaxID=2794938 RepID=UPI0018DC3B5D|nr:hypothetical protein [methane-oxidizing endosymbiont of Gigantopelta aegis]